MERVYFCSRLCRDTTFEGVPSTRSCPYLISSSGHRGLVNLKAGPSFFSIPKPRMSWPVVHPETVMKQLYSFETSPGSWRNAFEMTCISISRSASVCLPTVSFSPIYKVYLGIVILHRSKVLPEVESLLWKVAWIRWIPNIGTALPINRCRLEDGGS